MNITLKQLHDILYSGATFEISEEDIRCVDNCYHFLEQFAREKIIYGINTGFGPMAQWRVDDQYLSDLQYNIIRSHATGAGDPLPDDYVKAAMIARLGSFLQGKSGVHIEIVKLLTEFVNRNIIPYIPQHGSVGASGDLVQLAHIALCLIGEGKVHYQGEWLPTSEVLKQCRLKPMGIHVREGLSCTNGTSVMTGIAAIMENDDETIVLQMIYNPPDIIRREGHAILVRQQSCSRLGHHHAMNASLFNGHAIFLDEISTFC